MDHMPIIDFVGHQTLELIKTHHYHCVEGLTLMLVYGMNIHVQSDQSIIHRMSNLI